MTIRNHGGLRTAIRPLAPSTQFPGWLLRAVLVALIFALWAAGGLGAQTLRNPDGSGSSGPGGITTLPTCAPPSSGIWFVFQDCVMTGARTAPSDVRVLDGVTLHLASGSSLDIDFAAHHLRIGTGSRVIIGDGGKIQ